jgi:hypothetical protein
MTTVEIMPLGKSYARCFCNVLRNRMDLEVGLVLGGAIDLVDGPRMRGNAGSVNVRCAAQQEAPSRSSDGGSQESETTVSSSNDTQTIPKVTSREKSQTRST